jgi:hypothetical protein
MFFSIVHWNHDINLFLGPYTLRYHKGELCGGCDLTHISTPTTFHPSPCGKGYRSSGHLLEKHEHFFYSSSSEGAH